jgi:hypothetical protein
MTSNDDIRKDPAWFPASLSPDYETIQFVQLSRTRLADEAFLDQRMDTSRDTTRSVAVAEVAPAFQQTPGPLPVFVFHSAFCCSTLLARALDVPGRCLALKEPDVLMGVANALRTRNDGAANQRLFNTVLGLLARRFDEREPILIKPTNSANNLLPHVLATGARVLVLYGDLRSFLVSVLKKGEACKAFVRTQFNIFSLDAGGLNSIPSRQAMTFTDLQVAALVWRHQLETFQSLLSGTTSDHAASLDFRDLVRSPAPTLAAVANHFELAHDRALLDDIAAGSVFHRNAKFADQEMSPRQREQEAGEVEANFGDAIDQVCDWAQQLDLGGGLQLPLPQALQLPR